MKPYLPIFLFVSTLAMLSCTSTDDKKSDQVIIKEKKYTTWDQDRTFSQDYLPWKGLLQNIDGFPGHSEKIPVWAWNNVPNSNFPLFIGIAYPHANLETERSVALQYAAMQAVRYKEIIGMAHAISVHTSLGHYYGQEVYAHFNENEVTSIAESLTVYAEYRDESGTYLLASLHDLEGTLHFPKIPEGYTIDLSSSLPKIPGYILALGGSRKYIRMSDSLIAADENALAELLRQKEVHIVTQQDLDGRIGESGGATPSTATA